MLFTMGLPDKLDLIAEPVISPDLGVGPRSFSELPLIQAHNSLPIFFIGVFRGRVCRALA